MTHHLLKDSPPFNIMTRVCRFIISACRKACHRYLCNRPRSHNVFTAQFFGAQTGTLDFSLPISRHISRLLRKRHVEHVVGWLRPRLSDLVTFFLHCRGPWTKTTRTCSSPSASLYLEFVNEVHTETTLSVDSPRTKTMHTSL